MHAKDCQRPLDIAFNLLFSDVGVCYRNILVLTLCMCLIHNFYDSVTLYINLFVNVHETC